MKWYTINVIFENGVVLIIRNGYKTPGIRYSTYSAFLLQGKGITVVKNTQVSGKSYT